MRVQTSTPANRLSFKSYMKKLFEYRRMGHIRRALRRLRRQHGTPLRQELLAQRQRARVEAFEASCKGVGRLATVPSHWMPRDGRQRACQKLPAPEDFRYAVNPEGVIRFVYSLRREAILRGRMRVFRSGGGAPLYIDLDAIRHIDLDGALILSAELDRIRHFRGMRALVDDANWSPYVRAVLYEFGFYRLVEARRVSEDVWIPEIKEILRERGQAVVKFISGNRTDGRKAEDLQDDLQAERPDYEKIRLDFYDGLIEAFTNAVQHAYDPEISGDGLYSIKSWWAGGLVDIHGGYLYMAVYDQGVGIPATLPRKTFWQAIVQGGRAEWTDAEVIAGGLEYGRTRTMHGGRGNGLWTMCNIVQGFEEAEVRITSGCGEVTFEKGRQLKLEVLPSRFPGTMVRWRVQLPAESNQND